MKLSLKEKMSYGVGAIGKDMVYALVSSFLLYYYNTVLGISATFVGILFLVARILDAVNDPFMGIIVEKTNTRFGKFRPWLIIGSICSGVIMYFMYAVPESLTGNGLLIYASVAYILWGTTYTLMDIPYWSMIPSITESGKDRENISVIARSCAGFGFAVITVLTMVLVPILGKGSEREGFRIFAAIVCIFFIVAEIITVRNVKEKTKPVCKTPKIKEMFQALFHNDQALVIVIMIVVFNASIYLTGSLAIYFFKYDIGNGALYGLFGMVGGATQIFSMMLLPILRKKYECTKIFIGAVITAVLGYIMLFVLGTLNLSNIVLLCIAAVIIYFGFGLATVLTTIFLADTVDYGEWKTNSRNESVVFSMQTFVVQLASAFSALIAGVGLDFIKFDANLKVQAASTLLGLRTLMAIFPIFGLIITVIVFIRKYKLNESYLFLIESELKQRGESNIPSAEENAF